MIALMLRPSQKVLILGFTTISMTFFIFSYHVHEKSILVPLIMVPLASRYIGGKLCWDLIVAGCVGMYHLLAEDGQRISYIVCVSFYIFISHEYNKC